MSIITRKHHKPDKDLTTHPTSRDVFQQLFDWDPASFFARRMPELLAGNGSAVFPPMNVAEDENTYDVSIEMPGLEEKDIRVEILGHQLVVSAERVWTQEDDQKQYHRVESRYGSMQRSVALPDDARFDIDAIDARYDKGVLHVRVPKVEPTPARRIEVKGTKS